MHVFSHSHPIPRNPVLQSGAAQSIPEILMIAACYSQHGNVETIELVKNMIRPKPSVGQVLVKVHSTCVNPVDVKFRSNHIPTQIIPLPKIIGSDFSGTIVDNSQSKTMNFSLGDKVFGMMPLILTGWGSTCEYLAIDEDLITNVPATLDLGEAAALPLVGLTVLQGFHNFVSVNGKGGTKGKRVLIHAGSGGVGSFAIQYCKNELEMEVYTTCGPSNIEFVKSLGADVAIDYKSQNFEDLVSECDVIFDPISYLYEEKAFRKDSKLLKKKGAFYINVASSYNSLRESDRDPFNLAIPEARIDKLIGGAVTSLTRNTLFNLGFSVAHYDHVVVHPSGKVMAEVARLVGEGKVKSVVDSVFPIDEARKAHEKVEKGHSKGKVLIRVDRI